MPKLGKSTKSMSVPKYGAIASRKGGNGGYNRKSDCECTPPASHKTKYDYFGKPVRQ